MRWADYFIIAILFLLFIIQMSILPFFAIAGITPRLLLLVVIAESFRPNNSETSLLGAFTAGIFLDLFSPIPLGITSLTYMTIVIFIILIYHELPYDNWLIPPILTGLSTIIYLLLSYALLRISGLEVDSQIITANILVIPLHAILILPVNYIVTAWNNIIKPIPVKL